MKKKNVFLGVLGAAAVAYALIAQRAEAGRDDIIAVCQTCKMIVYQRSPKSEWKACAAAAKNHRLIERGKGRGGHNCSCTGL